MDSRSPSKCPPSEVALDDGMRKMDATPPAFLPINADTAAFRTLEVAAALATPPMLLRFAGGNPALGNGILLCRLRDWLRCRARPSLSQQRLLLLE